MLQYYGLDWADAVLSIAGIYCLSRKHRIGFIFNAIGAVFGLILFIMINSYPFILINVVWVYLNLDGYKNWTKDA